MLSHTTKLTTDDANKNNHFDIFLFWIETAGPVLMLGYPTFSQDISLRNMLSKMFLLHSKNVLQNGNGNDANCTTVKGWQGCLRAEVPGMNRLQLSIIMLK